MKAVLFSSLGTEGYQGMGVCSISLKKSRGGLYFED